MRDILARLPKSGRILDLGIGTGRELPFLLDAGFEVTGIDFAPRMIEECNKRRRTVPIVLGDFYAPLSFEDRSFDAAIALFGTLSHPPDERAHARLAKELRRVVKQMILFEAPSRAWARNEPAVLHQDGGSQIVVVVLTEAEWQQAFAPHFDLSFEHPSPMDLLAVGR